MSIKVTNPTFVNGGNAEGYSNSGLIELIGAAEKRVATLGAMKTESKTVKAMIKKEEDGIADVVKVLDARKVD